MAYVCSDLQTIDNVQTCAVWVEQSTLLPSLSYSEATSIGVAFWLCLATVWGLKTIRVQLFEK